jgi:hypothetical protein
MCHDTSLKDKLYRIQSVAVNKLADHEKKKFKRDTYFDDYTRQKDKAPNCASYNLTFDWTKKFATNTGKFLKGNKVTMTERIIKDNHKRPGPATYKLKQFIGENVKK